MAPRNVALLLSGLALLRGAGAITPQQMLSANRYGEAFPNPSGDFALFTVSKYSFEDQETSHAWNRLDLKTGDVSVWPGDSNITEFVFIGSSPTTMLYLNESSPAGDGGVSLYYGDADAIQNARLVASLPAPLSGLKAALTPSGDIHFLLSGKASSNGSAYNEKLAHKPKSSARIYSSLYPRLWSHWVTPEKNAVFGGVLKTAGGPYGNGTVSNGTYSFDGRLANYVTGICNVTCAESPVDQEGGTDDYELSPDGSKVVFRTKDINLSLSNYTSSPLYLVPFEGAASDAVVLNPNGGTHYPEAQGYSTGPKFSPTGDKLVYVQQNGINYESDRGILYIANADAADPQITRVAGDWDRSIGSALWSADGQTIFAVAADKGRTRIFPIPATAGDSYKPENITDEGSVAGVHVIPQGLLVSDSKIWTSRDIYTVAGDGASKQAHFQANQVDAELAGLGPEDVAEFYYKSNTSEMEQQSWIIYPEGFDAAKTYPLAFIVHGGPQVPQSNGWSTRWNLKVWADQGYVVVAPNPTGTPGWGQNFTDAIQGRWGTLPYWDLVHAWDHVNATLPYVDTSRGIEAGASFGGYMTNWIQGHELGRRFRALVTHDGTTSSLNNYNTDELWFMDHDFEGAFTSASLRPGSPYYDNNPLLHVDAWATPHFVVHSDLDYRLAVSEGTLLFNLLQVRGVPSKFLNYPDEGHHVLKPENSLVWHDEIFKWINYYSGLSNATSPY